MYNTNAIQECTAGLIGFDQSRTPDVPRIAADLTTSRSGLYYRGFHPLITIDNLLNMLETGLIHTSEGIDVAGGFPYTFPFALGGGTVHTVEEYLSEFLRKAVGHSANKLLQTLFQQRKLDKAIKSVFEDTKLFAGAGSYTDKVIRQGRFVGLELTMKGGRDIAATLHHLGVQFDTVQNGLNLYLYAEGVEAPLWTQAITTNKRNEFSWHPIAQESLTEGTYYLGYYEDDLAGQAISRKSDLSQMPGGCCNTESITLYNTWSKHIGVKAFSVDAAYLSEDKRLYVGDYLKTVSDTNWGLNLAFSMKCDLTNFLCRHSDMLTNALGLQVAVDLITEMAYSTRDNAQHQKLVGLAFAALENSQTGTPGLVSQLAAAIKALEFDMSDFDSRCLPCNNAPQLKRRAI